MQTLIDFRMLCPFNEPTALLDIILAKYINLSVADSAANAVKGAFAFPHVGCLPPGRFRRVPGTHGGRRSS